MHNLGFCGSIVKGRTMLGGAISPTLPQTRIAPGLLPLQNRFRNKLQKLCARVIVLRTLVGGSALSYLTP